MAGFRVRVEDKEHNEAISEVCIICNCHDGKLTSGAQGRDKIRNAAAQRRDSVLQRLANVPNDGFKYHSNNQCYRKYTLPENIRRAVNRLAENRGELDCNGNSLESNEKKVSKRITRSEQTWNINNYCFLCNKERCKSNKSTAELSAISKAKNVLKIAQKFDDDVYTRLSMFTTPDKLLDAGVRYHKNCMRQYEQKYEREHGDENKPCSPKLSDADVGCDSNNNSPNNIDNCNIDYDNSSENDNDRKTDRKSSENVRLSHYNSQQRRQVVSQWLHEQMPHLEAGEAFTLTEICTAVNEHLPRDSAMRNDDVKRYLIQLSGEHLQFSVSSSPRTPTLVFHARVTIADVVDLLRRKDPLTESAKMIKNSMNHVNFNLEDKFCDATDLERAYDNVTIPDPLLQFFGALFNFKPQDFVDESSDSELESEFLKRNKVSDSKILKLKTLYQIIYFILNRGLKKTPLHVMLGLSVHNTARNSGLVKSLNHLGLSISYDSVQRIRTRLAAYAIETCTKTVPLPSHFDEEIFTVVAFDNIDHKDTGNTGMHSTHDTPCIVVQKKSDVIHQKPNLSDVSINLRNRTISAELPCQQLKSFEKPPKEFSLPAEYPPTEAPPSVTSEMYNRIRRDDLAWFLTRGNFRKKFDEWISSDEQQKIPSWPAFNSVLQEDYRTKDIIGFLPVLPHPVTEYATVYTALLNFKDILSQLKNQTKLPVFCDEGVYHIARHIQFAHSEEFADIILMLGTFHLTKVMLTCVGRYLKGSGVEDILTETETVGVSTTDQVLNGSNYARSLYAFYLLEEATQRIQLKEFFDAVGIDKYEEELSLLSDLHDAVAEESLDEGRVMLNDFQVISSHLEKDLYAFIEKRCSESELFKFWNTFLVIMRVTKDVIRADRSGNWLLHVDAVKKCLPIFHILDRTNYARWGSVYLYDILSLETQAPEVYAHFLAGGFSVKQSNSSFTSVGTDQALEQTINRSCKSNSGIVGQSRKKEFVASWGLTHHELSAISNIFRQITQVRNDNHELMTHREYSTTRTIVSEEKVTKIISYIAGHVNPFTAGRQPLRNIVTEVLLPPAETKELLTIIPDGCSIFNQFCLERFHEKKKLVTDKIERVSLPTFDNRKDDQKTKTVVKPLPRQVENATRLIKLAEQRNYDEKQLFSFELMQKNLLFEGENTLRKEKNLKSILDELEKPMQKTPCAITPKSPNICYLVDVMTICRKINMRLLQTFKDFGQAFCESVSKLVGGIIHRVDFIFESYDGPLVIQERGSSAAYHDIHEGIAVPKDAKKFWASKDNNVLIQKFLRQYILAHGHECWTSGEILLSAMDSTPCQSLKHQPLPKAELLQRVTPIHGTDITMIHHLNHAVQCGHQRVMMSSDSVGVAMIAMYYWQVNNTNGLQKLWLCGVGAKKYPIHALADHHGPARCQILRALYHLTGSNFTSRVATKLAALRATPEKYLMEFAKGTSQDDIASSIEHAEKYLVKVVHNSSEATTFDELRYLLHHHGKRIAVTDLPPTSGSMKFHILRAFFFTHSQITCLDESPIFLNPCDFGYEEKENCLRPSSVTELYPPIHDLVPNCTDVRCQRGGCHCASAEKPCIPFCKCQVDGTCKNPFNDK